MKSKHTSLTAAGRARWLFVPLVLLLVLSGCMSSSSGTPLDPAQVALIVKGKTTRAEVEALLGKPEMTTLLGDGRRMVAYSYNAMSSGVNPATAMLGPFARIKASTRIQTLQLYVSQEGVVEDYEFSDNIRDIEGNVLRNRSTVRETNP